MGQIARNPEFYTTGIPLMFFHPVDDPADPRAVDVFALARAYNGITDVATGRVLNMYDRDTCFTAEEILKTAYVGNIAESSMDGEIKSVEHTAAVEGRKEIDKIVLIRRSLEYTMQFDEMNKQNMLRFFAAQSVVYPSSEALVAKTTAKGAQAAAADFVEGIVEIMDNGATVAGTNSAALESLVTERLASQNAEFTPHNIAGTPTYLAGVFYFLVGDAQRYPKVEAKLAPYRNKVLCGFFKYDPAVDKMKLQAWPAGMDAASYAYKATSFDNRVRVLTMAGAETVSGITTNDRVLDRITAIPSTELEMWAFDASTASTHTLTVQLPANVGRGSVRVTLKGKRWDTGQGKWITHTEALYDRPQGTEATNNTSPLYPEVGTSIFADPAASMINYNTGVLTIEVPDAFVTDSATNSLNNQDITVTASVHSMANAHVAWTGTLWGRHNEALSTLRVNRGKPEVSGCALIVHQNNVGVSMFHLVPRCVLRPDGTIDFAKDDWEKGGFVMSCTKDDAAYIPNIERRIKVPFGLTMMFKYRTVK